MRNQRILVVILLTVVGWLASNLAFQQAKASHTKGADMYYVCLNPSNKIYRVYLKLYADCGGSANLICNQPDGDISVRGLPFNCAPQFVNPLTGWQQLPTPIPNTSPQLYYPPCDGGSSGSQLPQVSPICYPDGVPFIETTCTQPGSLYPGVIEVTWYADFVFPNTNCTAYEITWEQCCRTAALATQFGPGIDSEASNIRITIPMNNGLNCNSSPRFTIPPVPYVFLNNSLVFNQGAIDPDGDSLAYRLDFCRGTNGAFLTNYSAYALPVGQLSPTNPIPSIPTITLDPVTGTLNMTPTELGDYVICLFVDEYRNGVLIGSIERELQVTVLNPAIIGNIGSGQIEFFYPPFLTEVRRKVIDVSSGVRQDTLTNESESLLFGSVFDTVCVNSTLNFQILGTDTNSTEKVRLIANIPPNMTGATFVAPTQPQKTPTGYFTWTPTVASANPYQFIVSIKDDNCLQSTSIQYAFSILVRELIQVQPSATVNCNEANFTPSVNNPDFSYYWSGPGGLTGNINNTSPSLTHFYTAPGTYDYTLRVVQPGGCYSEITEQVTIANTGVVMVNGAGSDVTVCSGSTYQLGSPNVNGQTYNWTPTSNLSVTNISNPEVFLVNNGSQPDTVLYTVNASNGTCSFNDVVRLIINPLPVATVQGLQPKYCAGDTVILSGPDNMTAYLWQASTPNAIVGSTTNKIVKLVSNQPVSLKLYVTAGNCVSNALEIPIPITPVPVLTILGSKEVCGGQKALLTATGAQAYLWNGVTSGASVSFTPTQDTTLTVIGMNSDFTCPSDPTTVTIKVVPQPSVIILNKSKNEQCVNGNKFNFDAYGSGEKFEWRFGDGAIPAVSLSQTPPVLRYTTPGHKRITLISYTGAENCPSDTAEYFVDVYINPVAVLKPFQPQCFYGHNFNFEAETVPNAEYSWDFGAEAVERNFTDQNPRNVTFKIPSNHYCRLIVKVGICSDTVNFRVWVYPSPDAPTALTDSLCQDFPAKLVALTPKNGIMNWYRYPIDSVPVFVGREFNTPRLHDTTTYYLENVNSFKCGSPRTPVTVMIYPAPAIEMQMPVRQFYLPQALVQFRANVPENVVSWYWTFGNNDGLTSTQPNPVYEYREPGEYEITLTVIDEKGCVNSIILPKYINVEENEAVVAPSAFSPNGDLNNDEFFIFQRLTTDFKIVIFARDGNKVFESKDPNFRWNGEKMNNGGHVPEGAYMYFISGTDYKGQKIEQKGSVTVIR